MISRCYLILLICMLGISTLISQESFSVKLSKDTLLLGNIIKVEFIAENIQGKFEAPVFEELEIISGPNVSSSFRIFNGESSRTEKYSYVLRPLNIGTSTIPPGYFISDENSFETNAIDFTILPNPDGIIEQESKETMDFEFPDFNFDFSFPQFENEPVEEEEKEEKSKRKLKKI